MESHLFFICMPVLMVGGACALGSAWFASHYLCSICGMIRARHSFFFCAWNTMPRIFVLAALALLFQRKLATIPFHWFSPLQFLCASSDSCQLPNYPITTLHRAPQPLRPLEPGIEASLATGGIPNHNRRILAILAHIRPSSTSSWVCWRLA